MDIKRKQAEIAELTLRVDMAKEEEEKGEKKTSMSRRRWRKIRRRRMYEEGVAPPPTTWTRHQRVPKLQFSVRPQTTLFRPRRRSRTRLTRRGKSWKLLLGLLRSGRPL